MRRLTQAGVRFLEASLEPWRDTSRRVLVDGAERERDPSYGRCRVPQQERVRSTCIDRWNLYISIPTPTSTAYIAREKNTDTSLARSGEDGCSGP